MGAKNAKSSEPEPKEIEHGGKVIADTDFDLVDFKGGRNYDEAQTPVFLGAGFHNRFGISKLFLSNLP